LEPFAERVSMTYPEDAAAMYNADFNDFQLSEESIHSGSSTAAST
jgi:hypothetical protein